MTAAGRTYLDRLGRPITDARAIEARSLLTQLRRMITIGVKAGRPWNAAVTVGELSRAAKMPPERTVFVIRDFDAWLWGLVEEGPMETWWVYEDGE